MFYERAEEPMFDPLNSCAIIGALEVSLAEGILPLIHGTGGCPCLMWLMMASNPTYFGLSEIKLPCTSITKNDVVYGGIKKLEENVRRAIEVYSPEAIMILISCCAAIIGDDIHTVAETMSRELKIPVMGVDTRENLWDHTEGRINAQLTLVRNIVEPPAKKESNAVNIIGLYPGDYNWRGDLKEIKRMLQGIGLSVNAVFTGGSNFQELKGAAQASMNIVVSSVFGLKVAQEMERLFHIPYLDIMPPYGITGSQRWLGTIAERMDINKRLVEEFIQEESRLAAQSVVPYLASFGQVRLLRQMPTALIGNTGRVAALADFISRELGMKPVLIGLKRANPASKRFLDEVKSDLGMEFDLIEDIKSLADLVKALGKTSFDFLMASDIEKYVAKKINDKLAFAGIESPIFFRMNVLENPYMGFRGVPHLYQDIINARFELYQTSRPYGSFWDLVDNYKLAEELPLEGAAKEKH